MTIISKTTSFLEDAVYTLAMITAKMDTHEDNGDVYFSNLEFDRRELDAFTNILTPVDYIRGGYNWLETAGWNEDMILSEIDYFRNKHFMNGIPPINYSGIPPIIYMPVEEARLFTVLLDTPMNYVGQALAGIRVNAQETGLEFTAGTGIRRPPKFISLAGQQDFIVSADGSAPINEVLIVSVGGIVQSSYDYAIVSLVYPNDTIRMLTPVEEDVEVVVEYFTNIATFTAIDYVNWGDIHGSIVNQLDLQIELDARENYLGLPGDDNYVLSSDVLGNRSWIPSNAKGVVVKRPSTFIATLGQVVYTMPGAISGEIKEILLVTVGGVPQTYSDYTIHTTVLVNDSIQLNEAPLEGYPVVVEYFTLLPSISTNAVIDTFLKLLDTPISYNGESGKIVVVNGPETGLLFVDFPTSIWGGIAGDISNQIDLQDALGLKADLSIVSGHTANVSNPHIVTKTQVGLSNVDNTSDVNKPISTATQTALDLKLQEAPIDGETYARKDGAWENIVSAAGLELSLTAIGVMIDTTGDDKGLKITDGQLAVGSWQTPKESVFGAGDSTTETMVCFHELGATPGTFVDVTAILASDDASTTGLLGGLAVGDSLYVGGDFLFTGLKAKIATDGLVEADNIIVEYWNGTGWNPTTTMCTGANDPFFQYADELAQNGLGSEQWRFDFDPYGLLPDWALGTVNGEVKYWARLRVVTAITLDAIIEQIKLHTDRAEINATGFLEFYGKSRFRVIIASGMKNYTKNALSDPPNDSVNYTPTIRAAYQDNEFASNNLDSFLYQYEVQRGVDTSIPIKVNISYYGKGSSDGDILHGLEVVRVGLDFVFDGNASSVFEAEATSLLGADTLKRQVKVAYVDISKYKAGDTVMFCISRDGSDALDTYSGNMVVENVVIVGYKWTV